MENASPLYRAAQVRALDARAIAHGGIPGYVLMQRAAAYAYTVLRARWPQAQRLMIVAGPGNNGGDALELGRLAVMDGLQVDGVLVADPGRLRGEARQAYNAAMAAGLVIRPVEILATLLPLADVVVDGLLGTGLSRPVSAQFSDLIAQINQSGKNVLALDLPSGIHADTGAVMGAAVHACATVSFIARKQGLYTGAALDCVGERVFSSLEVPQDTYAEEESSAHTLDASVLQRALPVRPKDCHKGQFGHVLAIGGGPGYSGAIRLCAHAALRSGAGLVSVLTHPECLDIVAASHAELMVHGAAEQDLTPLDALCERASVVAIGPGLGANTWSQAILQRVLKIARERDLPLVLDADALNGLDDFSLLPPASILTPHPGEAARLLGVSKAQIQADRFSAARELSARSGAVVVLKGAGSLVAEPGGFCWVCSAGNSGMAVGGMGDVLTGMIAAFIAQGCDVPLAARAGVQAHAMAGDVAAQAGARGLLPRDLIAQLRVLVNPDGLWSADAHAASRP